MNGITLWMAFVDAIPVFIFLAAALMLMKDFGEEIKEKGLMSYGFLTSGSLMLFGGAILKLMWKTTYALGICDYTTLSESFFPMQTIGFAMMAMGIITYICKDAKKALIIRSVFATVVFGIFVFLMCAFTGSAKESADAVFKSGALVYESHMPFLLCTFIGFMAVQVLLIIVAFKRKAKIYSLAFVFSMIFMIAEAIVGSMFNGTSGMHWLAQIINILAESGLLLGAYGIYKNKNKTK